MRRAWEGIVERHEILRTRYADGGADDPQGADPVQIIDPPGRFELRTVDLAGEPAARREQRARQIADWERRRPFDLTAEAPLRVTVIALDAEQHLLVIHMHHIACDGAPRLVAELEALYRANVEGLGRAPVLAPVPVQYADFAAWEVAGRRDGRLRPHLDYWRRELLDAPTLALPLDRPRPRRPDWRGGAVDLVIKPEVSEAVHALAAEYRTSPYVVLLAAYQVLLAHLSGGADVAVGVPVSARLAPELDGLVGYLVNTVVVRVRHAGQPHLRGPADAGQSTVPGRVRPSGGAVRLGGRGAEPGARRRREPAVPGGLRHGLRPGGHVPPGRAAHRAAGALPHALGQVRPDPARRGVRAGAAVRPAGVRRRAPGRGDRAGLGLRTARRCSTQSCASRTSRWSRCASVFALRACCRRASVRLIRGLRRRFRSRQRQSLRRPVRRARPARRR